jgi:hypothetical protein
MTVDEREQFDRDGYLILRGALTEDEIAIGQQALTRAYAAGEAAGTLTKTRSLHQLSAIKACPELTFLLDHPKTFQYIWSILGWNVHVYHSHVDVHPTITEPQKFWWEWHQDGGRQNREIETDPRPRLSVKLAYWFSDVTETGRGNLMVIPGSHTTNWLPGPPSRGVEWPTPPGAIEVQVGPGDVVVFDRRIWHARSNNFSPVTRMAAFLGYTPRWIRIRDEVDELPAQPWWNDLNPVQQQLLGHCGDGTGDHAWGHYPQTTPLYGALAERDLFDRKDPPLIP